MATKSCDLVTSQLHAHMHRCKAGNLWNYSTIKKNGTNAAAAGGNSGASANIEER